MTRPLDLPARVLVCDDSEALRFVVRASLDSQKDMTVVGEAADGPSAVLLASRESPDVIVLDLTMPGLSAEALLPALRQSAPAAGVVLFSGMAPDRMNALAHGLDGVSQVPKASSPANLVRAVRAVRAAMAA